MFKISILTAIFTMVGLQQAIAAPITPTTIIGRYKVEGSVAFQKVDLNFHVIDETNFEIERLDRDGNAGETCNGTFQVNSSLFFWDLEVIAFGKTFQGMFTCPSNRSKEIDFNIDFKDKTTEDLIRGTTVVITTSLSPMKVTAKVKRVN